jgi:uncharacterized peroxidase-related enzyme
MSRIRPTTLDDAPAASRPLLEQVKASLGMVPQLFATIAHSPVSLQALLGSMQALGGGELTGTEIEAINLHASELNGCGYCVAAHAALGKRAGLGGEGIAAARRGQSSDARTGAILDLVRRVVRTGGLGAGGELLRARAVGVSDGAIIEVIAHVSLKAFTNAVAIVAQTEIDFPKPGDLPQL